MLARDTTTIPNIALDEEIEAVNAIYGTNVLSPVVDDNHAKGSSADQYQHLVLQLPGQSTSFVLSVAPDYPRSCPRVDGTRSTGDGGKKGEGHHAATLIRDTLRRVWIPDSVCLFDLIEEVSPLLVPLRLPGGTGATIGSCGEGNTSTTTIEKKKKCEGHRLDDVEDEDADIALTKGQTEAIETATMISGSSSSYAAPSWITSEPVTEKKSVFIARCARVTEGKMEAEAFVLDLLSTNKKVGAATHNVRAWRMRDPETGVTVQDCNDDGEAAAGGRLLHLLQLMDVWNVVVVVTRWYGGVRLGPDRFRLINQVAREALAKSGLVKTRRKEDLPGRRRARDRRDLCSR